MIRNRQQIEALEEKYLAPYAVKSSQSQGRVYAEEEAKDRTCFQRDRNRVIYSKSFMRLRGKTQVVYAHHGDHFRTRSTHTHYVANVSRDLARALGLNEDLAEVIGLAHDLGHTCFGHEGQDALSECLKKYGSHFEHNEQSLHIVTRLEKKSPHYPGLNLSQEVLDGIDKHRTAYDNPQSQNHLMPCLEAQVVNIADEIAYKYHDLDDAVRAGAIGIDQLNQVQLWAEARQEVKDQKGEILFWNVRSKVMEKMIRDLVTHSDRQLQKHGIDSVEKIYQTRELLVGFSAQMQQKMVELGTFLHRGFYKSPQVKAYNEEGRKVITALFNHFDQYPDKLPEEFRQRLEDEEKYIVVKDYVAGMTDGYALEIYKSLN
jgi:dGTPase